MRVGKYPQILFAAFGAVHFPCSRLKGLLINGCRVESLKRLLKIEGCLQLGITYNGQRWACNTFKKKKKTCINPQTFPRRLGCARQSFSN